jgi:hypothetical protein
MLRLRSWLAAGATLAVLAASGPAFAHGWTDVHQGGAGSQNPMIGSPAAWGSPPPGGGWGERHHGPFGGWGRRGHRGAQASNGSCLDQGTVTGNGYGTVSGTVYGTVYAADGSQSVTLVEPDGQMLTLPLAPDAAVTQNGQPSSPSALAPGQSVSVTVVCEPEAGGIAIGPPSASPGAPPAPGSPAGQVAQMKLSPDPIAAPGSLAAGQSVSVTVTAEDADGDPVPGATVYLSFVPGAGGGSASVGGTPITGDPAAFTAGSDGTVTVTYTAPATLPSQGADGLMAANAATAPSVTAGDSYVFSAADQGD